MNQLAGVSMFNSKSSLKSYYLYIIRGAFLFLFFLTSNHLKGQKDTVLLLKPIEINDFSPENFTYGSFFKKIDSNYINILPNSSLGDLIQRLTPAYVRSYGNGMLSSVSFRGLGSERTNVIWNGFTINYPNLGTGDHSVYPIGGFNLIQIQQGSLSANYGNGSIGGSVMLNYKPEWKNQFGVRFNQEFGSYNTWQTGLNILYGTKNFQGKTYFQRSSSLNNFAYKDLTTLGFPVKELENASFEQYAVIQDIYFQLSKWEGGIHFWYNRMQRNIPPAMGANNVNASEQDINLRFVFDLKYKAKWGKVIVSGAYFRDEINYQDDGISDSTLTNTYQIQIESDLLFVKKWTFKIGGQFQYFEADQDFYQKTRYESRGAAFLLVNYIPLPQLRFSYNIRQQWVSGFSPPITGSLGMDWDCLKIEQNNWQNILTWKVNVANGYRLPTLNDRYWVPGGSDSLKAEFAWNFETGLGFQTKTINWTINTEFSGYYSWVDNWIQWYPTNLGYWAPQNIGKVELAGGKFDFQLDWHKNKWQTQFNTGYALTYTWDRSVNVNSGNQLIYVPIHTMNADFKLSYSGVYIQGFFKFTSERFIRSDLSKSLPHFFLLDLAIGKVFHFKFLDIGISFKLNNTLNTQYQLIENRPLPGIHYLAGIQLAFHQNHINSIKNKKISKL